jgi:hypothetical protein
MYKAILSFIVNSVPMIVIIRLDRIIQTFHLDCPIKHALDHDRGSGNDRKKLKTFLSSLLISSIIFSFALLSFVDFSIAQEKNQDECKPTYGHYWRSYKWGWYGARRVVKTPVEAREIIQQVYIMNRRIKIGMIRESPHFYVAEITNRRGVVIDLILIDKRTGRIRSMY